MAINQDYLRRVYEENLRIVLDYLINLLKRLSQGKAIITADHGELLGERGLYGHILDLRVPELIEVPWLEVQI